MTGIGWGMGAAGGVWMILGVVVVVAIMWFISAALPGRGQSPVEDAGATLRTRFARGEISLDEYEQARRVLGSE